MMNMIRKRSVIAVAAVLIAVSSAAAIIAISYLRDGSAEYELTVYRTGCGWGYDIGIDGKTLIHQPFFAGLAGNVAFLTGLRPLMRGKLVVDRLGRGKSGLECRRGTLGSWTRKQK